MDSQTADLTLENFFGRTVDFVGGIDNEALDFSQLAEFINSENTQGNTGYFGESLNGNASGKLLNVIVENKRAPGHSLPESPPDSSSEHPYSPQDNCEANINNSETIYTTLGQPIYKPNLLNTIISDNLILESHHIVVAESNGENQLLENGNILLNNDIRTSGSLVNNISADSGILLPETDAGRQILIQSASDSNPAFAERSLLVENCPRSAGNLLRLVKNGNANDYDKNQQLVHLGFNPNMEMARPALENSLCEPGMDNVQAVYTNLQNVPKKRKLSQDLPFVKSEPEHCSPSQLSPPGNISNSLDDDYAASEPCLSESQYQCIRFQPFQQNSWHTLCDQNLTELPAPHYQVDADKGFNFSNADDAFVCQKKNHFQITCQVQLVGDVQFVKTADGLQKISSFHLHFYGVKYDCPTQTIRVEQSQSDRSKKPFHPVLVELVNSQRTKITVGRLHFSETTSNNMRKKGKPNPEQRYFQLVVGLHAHTVQGNFPVVSHASQKIIVRASNPGQFESDMEPCWQKAQSPDSIYYPGKVGVNTDRPDESLVVHGNLKVTGHIIQPSDARAKTNIVECDSAEQLRNLRKLRIVQYDLIPDFAAHLNNNSESSDTGVIAQEVAEILPEAVSKAGDIMLENGTSIENFLVVNKERIFMENIGAVKELCKVTDNLEMRIDQLERINRRLSKLKRGDSLKSNSTVNSSKQSQKPHKIHTCAEENDLLCSTKLIQMVIVVLVLIMAICLAAITTLYLKDAARCNFFSQTPIRMDERILPTKKPVKMMKTVTPWNRLQTLPTAVTLKDSLSRISLDTPRILKEPSHIIGRPLECDPDVQDIENTNICQTYCCGKVPTPKELEGLRYAEESPPSAEQNKTMTLLEQINRNKLSVPIQTNDIEKQVRPKRETFEDEQMNLDGPEDDFFVITVKGKSFNTTLNSRYISKYGSSNYNISYVIPISKYMPDEFLYLIFRPLDSKVRDIEHCFNYNKQHECSLYFGSGSRKVNHLTRWLQEGMVLFEVDMVGLEKKIMTYRAQLGQNHNVCKLSSKELGQEFVQYNFHFYRSCNQ